MLTPSQRLELAAGLRQLSPWGRTMFCCVLLFLFLRSRVRRLARITPA